jgi:hypothetical protein
MNEWSMQALALALKTAPQTKWKALPVVDYAGQRLEFDTSRAQLSDLAHRAREKIGLAPAQWATTGRWPRLRNGGAFFLRVAILWALQKDATADAPHTTREAFHAPPWKEDAAAWLQAVTVDAWFAHELPRWAEEVAQEEVEFDRRYRDLLDEWECSFRGGGGDGDGCSFFPVQ